MTEKSKMSSELHSDVDLQAIQTSVAFKHISDAIEQYRRQFGLAFLALIAFSAIHVGLVVIANLYTLQTRVHNGVLTAASDSGSAPRPIATSSVVRSVDLEYVMSNMQEVEMKHVLQTLKSIDFIDAVGDYRQYTVTGFKLGGWKRSELTLYTSVGHLLKYVRGKGLVLADDKSGDCNCTVPMESRRRLSTIGIVNGNVVYSTKDGGDIVLGSSDATSYTSKPGSSGTIIGTKAYMAPITIADPVPGSEVHCMQQLIRDLMNTCASPSMRHLSAYDAENCEAHVHSLLTSNNQVSLAESEQAAAAMKTCIDMGSTWAKVNGAKSYIQKLDTQLWSHAKDLTTTTMCYVDEHDNRHDCQVFRDEHGYDADGPITDYTTAQDQSGQMASTYTNVKTKKCSESWYKSEFASASSTYSTNGGHDTNEFLHSSDDGVQVALQKSNDRIIGMLTWANSSMAIDDMMNLVENDLTVDWNQISGPQGMKADFVDKINALNAEIAAQVHHYAETQTAEELSCAEDNAKLNLRITSDMVYFLRRYMEDYDGFEALMNDMESNKDAYELELEDTQNFKCEAQALKNVMNAGYGTMDGGCTYEPLLHAWEDSYQNGEMSGAQKGSSNIAIISKRNTDAWVAQNTEGGVSTKDALKARLMRVVTRIQNEDPLAFDSGKWNTLLQGKGVGFMDNQMSKLIGEHGYQGVVEVYKASEYDNYSFDLDTHALSGSLTTFYGCNEGLTERYFADENTPIRMFSYDVCNLPSTTVELSATVSGSYFSFVMGAYDSYSIFLSYTFCSAIKDTSKFELSADREETFWKDGAEPISELNVFLHGFAGSHIFMSEAGIIMAYMFYGRHEIPMARFAPCNKQDVANMDGMGGASDLMTPETYNLSYEISMVQGDYAQPMCTSMAAVQGFIIICPENGGNPMPGRTWTSPSIFVGFSGDQMVHEVPTICGELLGLYVVAVGFSGFSAGGWGTMRVAYEYAGDVKLFNPMNGPLAPNICIVGYACHISCGYDFGICEITFMALGYAYSPYLVMEAGINIESLGYGDPIAYGILNMMKVATGIIQCFHFRGQSKIDSNGDENDETIDAYKWHANQDLGMTGTVFGSHGCKHIEISSECFLGYSWGMDSYSYGNKGGKSEAVVNIVYNPIKKQSQADGAKMGGTIDTSSMWTQSAADDLWCMQGIEASWVASSLPSTVDATMVFTLTVQFLPYCNPAVNSRQGHVSTGYNAIFNAHPFVVIVASNWAWEGSNAIVAMHCAANDWYGLLDPTDKYIRRMDWLYTNDYLHGVFISYDTADWDGHVYGQRDVKNSMWFQSDIYRVASNDFYGDGVGSVTYGYTGSNGWGDDDDAWGWNEFAGFDSTGEFSTWGFCYMAPDPPAYVKTTKGMESKCTSEVSGFMSFNIDGSGMGVINNRPFVAPFSVETWTIMAGYAEPEVDHENLKHMGEEAKKRAYGDANDSADAGYGDLACDISFVIEGNLDNYDGMSEYTKGSTTDWMSPASIFSNLGNGMSIGCGPDPGSSDVDYEYYIECTEMMMDFGSLDSYW